MCEMVQQETELNVQKIRCYENLYALIFLTIFGMETGKMNRY